MKIARWGDSDYEPFHQQVQRNLNFAIIDEVDNILIDEARTPLIISGPAFGDLRRYAKANDLAVRLTELEKKAQVKLKEIGLGVDIPDHPLTATESPNGEASDNHIAPGLPGESAAPSASESETAEGEDIDLSKIAPPEEGKEKRLGYYFEVKEKDRTCHLTDEGIRKA